MVLHSFGWLFKFKKFVDPLKMHKISRSIAGITYRDLPYEHDTHESKTNGHNTLKMDVMS